MAVVPGEFVAEAEIDIMIGMRTALVAGALAAFAWCGSGCGTLPQRAWCTNLTELTGYDCSYDTFEQCRASIAGLSGGTCSENPRYRGPRPPRRS